jgi:hypothetical protein
MCGFFIIFWVAIAALIVWVIARSRPDLRQGFRASSRTRSRRWTRPRRSCAAGWLAAR